MLLSAGAALSSLCVGQINLSPPNGPDLYLQKTRFGWVIGGSVSTNKAQKPSSSSCHSTTALQNDLTKFWEIEEGPQIRHLSESEAICEDHFNNTTTRNQQGRYVVALPFNEKIRHLGESRARAEKRFLALERRFNRDPDLKEKYHTIINEYLELGHMTKLDKDQVFSDGCYLPHHGVTKATSDTTKLRVVFDGSAETSSGISLNDALHTGPKIQDDLLYILLRFRIHQYVITGDIEKMYRQFLVRPQDRKFQRILWRGNSETIHTYELNTVTFGLSAAPYLAIRCLTQLAQDGAQQFPRAAKIITRDFYVDDALTGAATKKEAIALRQEMTHLLNSAGLNIRQWASNSIDLLRGLPDNSINSKLHLGESSTVKTLGIYWNSVDDTINYSIKISSSPSRITKRFISSEIAKIYDPLGLLGPVIIVAKILLQKIWTLKIDWDESLPMDVHDAWTQFRTKLPLLNNISSNRKTVISAEAEVQLHGFCDASNNAYGACVYLRTKDVTGTVHIELLVAKSKVAPLKTQTIPRLELCGALLLTSLVNTVQKALHVKIDRTILWTDSTIVLHWINTSPHTLKTFVANRIVEIQDKTQPSDWRHVRTEDNPADLISRGQSPEQFLQPSIWHRGPDWLLKDETDWPAWEFTPSSDILEEQKKTICLVTTPVDSNILDRYSSWGKLLRIVARCLRWKPNNTSKGCITTQELQMATNTVIKLLQRVHFAAELRCLEKDREAQTSTKLKRLTPFIDNDGILRVGGRLRHSDIPFATKHPIILPKSHATNLIIQNIHHSHLHAGVQGTLYAVRQRYWPIDGRSQVWTTIKGCVRCCRVRPPPVNYVMGNLPEERIIQSRPFTNVGVDYCGPFYIKERRHRNRTQIKVYVAVFVCFAVKAVHLELVSDMTSEAFIAALRRFIGRRGFCSNLYSDNGTNFVGAYNELREVQGLLKSDKHHNQIQAFLADRNVKWHFNPPQTPHFGGLWEAAVKSFKHHLKRVAGATLFTFEAFNTLIIEIEAVLNSRPLTPLSSDPNDLLVLTPGHFLIGDSLTSLREHDFRETPTNRLSSWQHVQKIKQDFWVRWHREYLNELTSRSKWTSGEHPIKDGTIVLLRDDNLPPMQWALGRVIKTSPGSDGIVRAVTVKTATSMLDRSVKRLVPLPIHPKDI